MTAGAAVLLLAGAAIAVFVKANERPHDHLDTNVTGLSYAKPTETKAVGVRPPKARSLRYLPSDRPCWPNFGGDAQRSLARTGIDLGKPTKPFWARGLGSYVEFPPSYCDGVLYVNTFKGTTYAVDSHNGRILWRHRSAGRLPSTPAIAGPRLLVSSTDGTETALDRGNGRVLWELRTRAKIESSPVVVGGTVYIGVSDGHLLALNVVNGRVRWAYQTGGRINASPSVSGRRVCISTYAGSVLCLDRRNGHRLWITYVRRNALQYESFYSSPSTDGRRVYVVSRAGKVVALSATTGRILWTRGLNSWGYTTPAIAYGKIYVGGFDGSLHAFDAATGSESWRAHVGGRILGAPVVIGKLVFFSTLETKTYAARADSGKIVWRIGMGKYSPLIATDRHYFMTLNGILIGFNAEGTARGTKKLAQALRRERRSSTAGSGVQRVPPPPKP